MNTFYQYKALSYKVFLSQFLQLKVSPYSQINNQNNRARFLSQVSKTKYNFLNPFLTMIISFFFMIIYFKRLLLIQRQNTGELKENNEINDFNTGKPTRIGRLRDTDRHNTSHKGPRIQPIGCSGRNYIRLLLLVVLVLSKYYLT